MIKALFLLAFCIPVFSYGQKMKAERRPQWQASLSYHALLERSEQQETKTMSLPGVSLGIRYESWSGYFEYQKSGVVQGETVGSFAVDRQVELMNLGFGRSFQLFRIPGLDFNLGLGLGALREEVITQLFEQTRRDESGWSSLLFAKAGTSYQFPGAKFLSIATDARLLKSPRLDPDPAFAFGVSVVVNY